MEINCQDHSIQVVHGAHMVTQHHQVIPGHHTPNQFNGPSGTMFFANQWCCSPGVLVDNILPNLNSQSNGRKPIPHPYAVNSTMLADSVALALNDVHTS
jgi:hypothetical protein